MVDRSREPGEATTTEGPPTAALRDEHAEMLSGVQGLSRTARTLPLISPEERDILIRENLKFLTDVLLRHAEAEEAVLYPDWTELVGFPGAAAFLIADHREIKALIGLLEEAPRDELEQLQQLLYSLEALISSHFHKEEELVFPALDEQRTDLTLHLLEQFRVAHAYAVPPPD